MSNASAWFFVFCGVTIRSAPIRSRMLFSPVVQVHGKQRASIERHSEHDDHNDKRRSAEWFATQIGQR